MDSSAYIENGLRILLTAGLVLINGFFVAAELAFVRIRDTQLETPSLRGDRRAAIARQIIGNIDAYISVTQFGITLASLGVGAAIAPEFSRLLDPLFSGFGIRSEEVRKTISIAIGFFVNSYVLIVVGELTPKGIAIRQTLGTALAIAKPLRWFYLVSYPFTWLLNQSAHALLRLIGIDLSSEVQGEHSEEELRLLLSTSQKLSGAASPGRGIILNALDLRHRTVREVMQPRQEIAALNTESTIAECIAVAEKTRYSRLPLCEGGDYDKTLGVVHIKDLYAVRLRARSGADLKEVARKLIYVPETARLERLLKLFLDRKLHLAIVVDEYGGTLGIVSLEDILEELVGQIQDEFDQEAPLLTRIGDGEWEAAGILPLHELAGLIGETLDEEGVTTVNGWVTQRLGGFPKTGDTIPVGKFLLRVEESDGLRVSKLRIARQPLPSAEAGEGPKDGG